MRASSCWADSSWANLSWKSSPPLGYVFVTRTRVNIPGQWRSQAYPAERCILATENTVTPRYGVHLYSRHLNYLWNNKTPNRDGINHFSFDISNQKLINQDLKVILIRLLFPYHSTTLQYDILVIFKHTMVRKDKVSSTESNLMWTIENLSTEKRLTVNENGIVVLQVRKSLRAYISQFINPRLKSAHMGSIWMSFGTEDNGNSFSLLCFLQFLSK